MKKICALWVCTLFIFSIAYVSLGEKEDVEGNAVIGTGINTNSVHNIDKDTYYSTIQAGINDADPGNTLEVSAGTYYENVEVNKTLTLIGENRNTTIIDGCNSGKVVHITADWVNVSGFSVTNGSWGIYFFNANNSWIENNNVYSNSLDGIMVCGWFGGFNTISSNNIYLNDDSGVHLSSPSSIENYVFNNSIYLNENGILLGDEGHQIIENNVIYDHHSTGGAGYGIICIWSDFNTISNNTIFSNEHGLYVVDSCDNFITGNEIDSNGYGIGLDYGIIGSYRNTIIGNTISNNTYTGIGTLESSYNQIIYHNNFINNSIPQGDGGPNQWNDTYPSGGNYWSDYTGIDIYSGPNQDRPGSDGIGDTPQTDIYDGVDYFPLMSPFNYTEFETPLQQGWNLISLPLRQLNDSIDAVLESIVGKWDYIQTYDPLDSSDPWKSYSIYKPEVLNDLDSINHLKAYWINITDTEPGVTLTVKGDSFGSAISIPLYAGWNLVGYPTQTPETVGNAFWGTSADKVEVCDPEEPYHVREVGPTYVMKPGEGYWVHVPANTLWVINW